MAGEVAESSCDVDFGLVLSIELAHCLGSCIVKALDVLYCLAGRILRLRDRDTFLRITIDDQTTQDEQDVLGVTT